MNIVLVGAVDEGLRAFQAILEQEEHREDIKAIVTLKTERHLQVSGYQSFDALADKFSKPIYKINHIRDRESYELFHALNPDLIIVIGWSQLLGDDILSLPRLGTIGLHTTLLPRHRGRAPIPWAIIKGLGKSGNTLFYFTPGVDNGDIIGQEHFYITLSDTARSVYAKASRAGVDLVLKYLPQIKTGLAPRIRQDESIADHWLRRRPEDGLIDWNRSATDIHNLIRGVSHPYPGAFSFIGGTKVFFWESNLLSPQELFLNVEAGAILDEARYEDGFIIGSGDGSPLLITSVQLEGKPPVSGLSFLRTHGIKIGSCFSNQAL